MADEEDDYMSAAFIEAAAQQITDDKTKTTKRKHSTIRKEKPPDKVKSFKVLEEENRKKGLESALNEENKGFRMLKMMGYKEGTGTFIY